MALGDSVAEQVWLPDVGAMQPNVGGKHRVINELFHRMREGPRTVGGEDMNNLELMTTRLL